MIDFQLTPADEKILSSAHEQALIGRRYASYYDKHEDELEPAEFPEAAGLPNPITLAEEGVSGSSGPRILHSLVMLENLLGRDFPASQQMGTRQHGAQDGRNS
jgi:acyl-CoA dehydrogenase